MIIAQLTGGLGNQMFQYAVGRALAAATGEELKLDLSWFEFTGREAFRLHALEITAGVASRDDLARTYAGEWRGSRDWLRRRLAAFGLTAAPADIRRLTEEKVPPHALLSLPPAEYHISGTWQDPALAETVRASLADEFRLKAPMSPRAEQWRRRIEDAGLVLIHVRRGDSIRDPAYSSSINALGPAYYQQAVAEMRSSIQNPAFIVFSDEPDLVRETMPALRDFDFMDDLSLAPHEVLQLMRSCRHSIIANSTLSWWAAWPKPGEVTISPDRWFRTPSLQWTNLSLKGWIEIPA